MAIALVLMSKRSPSSPSFRFSQKSHSARSGEYVDRRIAGICLSSLNCKRRSAKTRHLPGFSGFFDGSSLLHVIILQYRNRPFVRSVSASRPFAHRHDRSDLVSAITRLCRYEKTNRFQTIDVRRGDVDDRFLVIIVINRRRRVRNAVTGHGPRPMRAATKRFPVTGRRYRPRAIARVHCRRRPLGSARTRSRTQTARVLFHSVVVRYAPRYRNDNASADHSIGSRR